MGQPVTKTKSIRANVLLIQQAGAKRIWALPGHGDHTGISNVSTTLTVARNLSSLDSARGP